MSKKYTFNRYTDIFINIIMAICGLNETKANSAIDTLPAEFEYIIGACYYPAEAQSATSTGSNEEAEGWVEDIDGHEVEICDLIDAFVQPAAVVLNADEMSQLRTKFIEHERAFLENNDNELLIALEDKFLRKEREDIQDILEDEDAGKHARSFARRYAHM